MEIKDFYLWDVKSFNKVLEETIIKEQPSEIKDDRELVLDATEKLKHYIDLIIMEYRLERSERLVSEGKNVEENKKAASYYNGEIGYKWIEFYDAYNIDVEWETDYSDD